MRFYLKEKGKDRDGLSNYCPVEFRVITGLNLIQSEPPENVMGEFWYDEDDEVCVEFYAPRQPQTMA